MTTTWGSRPQAKRDKVDDVGVLDDAFTFVAWGVDYGRTTCSNGRMSGRRKDQGFRVLLEVWNTEEHRWMVSSHVGKVIGEENREERE